MTDAIPGEVVQVTTPDMVRVTGGKFAIFRRATGELEIFTDLEGQGMQRRTLSAAAIKILSGEGFLGRRLHQILGTVLPGMLPELPEKGDRA